MRALILFCLVINYFVGHSQIRFNIEPQEDGKSYVVKLKPNASYKGVKNITNSAQISFVVPTGGFQVGEIQNFIGDWQNNNNIIAPESNPQKDYIVFNLLGHIKDIVYNEGEEITLFYFENIGNATGHPRFVSNNDIKMFKHKKLNIGNQITVLGAGFKNAYTGTYATDNEEEEEEEESPELEESHVLYGNLVDESFNLDLNIKKQGILLEWLGQNKGITKSFVLEKSMDGVNFIPIKEIKDNNEDELKVIDESPDYGTNYYRVKQQFNNGDYLYSNIQSEVYLLDEASINIYPNPVKDNLNLKLGHFSKLEGQVRIFNMSGLEMNRKRFTENEKHLRFDVSSLQNGIYFLIIEGKNSKMLERQFIVENMK